jgi:hypothetical protein
MPHRKRPMVKILPEILPASAFNWGDPKPGVYRDVTDEDYFSALAWNHSALKYMEDSPRAATYRMGHRSDKTSDAKALGSFAHMLLLQPDRVGFATVDPPINPKTGEPYGRTTKAFAEYQALHKGKLIVSEDERVDAVRMVSEIRENDILEPVFTAASYREMVMVWHERELLCKAKVDAFDAQLGLLADLKTTESVNPVKFAKSVVKYGYHTQAAFYVRGAVACGFDPDVAYVIGAVQREPYDACAFEFSPEFAKIGDVKVAEWIDAAVKCEINEDWPGSPKGVQRLSPPGWLMSQFADALF